MKKLLHTLLLLAGLTAATTGFAAHSDYYLKIESGKSGAQIVDCSSGACTVPNLAPGDYTVTVCTKDGKPLEAAAYEIKSPRDSASGLPTGKRQHGVVRITKEWSASSPMLKLTVEDQNAPVELRCSPKAGYDVKKNEKA